MPPTNPSQSGHAAGLGCSAELGHELAAYVDRITGALGGDLLGVYVHGSLGRGCHNPLTSDVDLLVATERPCPEHLVPQILSAHQAAGIPVDAVFATRSQLRSDSVPTPVDLAVLPSAERAFRSPEGKLDFVLIRQDAYDCDVALAGAPTRELLSPVPWPALAHSLSLLLPHIVPRFKNPALMLCRIVYAFQSHSLCSKLAAGEWAAEALESRWRPLVVGALDKYRSGIADNQGPDATLWAFESYCRNRIRSSSGCGGTRV